MKRRNGEHDERHRLVQHRETDRRRGDERIRQLATSFGIPVDQLLGQLSQHLPAAVDQMSPNGTLEQQIGP